MKNNIVIGGGLAGLSVAYHLTLKKQNVTLIDEAQVGHKASTKAAGMITPASEVHLGEKTLMMCFLTAAEYYESFIARLTNSNPEAVDYVKRGSLMCATNNDGQRDLLRLAEFQRNMGLEVQNLTRAEVAEMEPLLSHRIIQAVYAKNEASIDNIKLVNALRAALIASGRCTIVENKKVYDVTWQGNSIQKITVGDKEKTELTADRFILATGLEHGIAALETELPLQMRPVKGQTLTLQCPPNTIRRPVRVYHRYPIYLVPRSDGRLIIGATSEELSDELNTAGGVMDLIYAAWQVLPTIYDSPIVETKVGLRPAAPDHKPILGKTHFDNLYTLTGLYRHGVMAAPYLSRELVNMMDDEHTELDLSEFSPARFAKENTVTN